jgi:formylmethanofuran dehydrogenase subunit E
MDATLPSTQTTAEIPASLAALLTASAELHHHLCPRQVLGVRMGLLAGEILGLELPQADKRLLAIVETDGCAADGIAVACNCWVGRRTLRVEDYGKVAATFVDTHTGQAVRLVPRLAARQLARAYAPEAGNKWEAQLLGYQRIPAETLLAAQPVRLRASLEKLVSHAGRKAACAQCGEEILNEREVVTGGRILCKACAGEAYYDVCEAWPSALTPGCYAVEQVDSRVS